MGNKYSKECDVWGLGVVLFEMIFGETPYQTLSHKRAVHKILNVYYTPI
jgi:serine/threonine protein kinase